jgi:hypothetical protein
MKVTLPPRAGIQRQTAETSTMFEVGLWSCTRTSPVTRPADCARARRSVWLRAEDEVADGANLSGALEQWIQDAVAVMDAAGSERAAVFGPRRLSAGHLAGDDLPRPFLELNMETDAVEPGFDLLAVAAPSVADDDAFRAW